MNHIYKVIWNKAKHCYTVVSEITKNHSHGNKRVRTMTAALAAVVMLTGFGGMGIEAANPAPNDTNIVIGKGAHVSVWNDVTKQNISGDIAIGEGAHAWNGEYSAPDGSYKSYIGVQEWFLDFGQGGVAFDHDEFFGLKKYYKVQDGSKIAGSIAIGKNTLARTGSTNIGDHTYMGKIGDMEITKDTNYINMQPGVYSTTLGANTYADLQSGKYAGGSVMAIGGGNKADNAVYSQLLGVQNTVTGTSNDNAKFTYVDGYKNTATNTKNTTLIGSLNTATGTESVTVTGDNNEITGNGNHVIGDNHKVTGANNILIGNNKEQKTHAGNDSVIIGNNASAGNGSVAFGNQAKAGNTGVALGMNASAGDKNISVSHDGTDISIALKDTLLLGSNATDGYVTVDGVKGTVWAGHAVSAGNVNMDGDSGEITGLTNTTLKASDFATAGRAATEEQLKLVKDQADSAGVEAAKHTQVVNGSNTTVEEIDNNGQKTYKVGLNKDILLGDITGNNVSISGTNGTIETTGNIITESRVIADQGAKLADIDVTKDTISGGLNGQSKVVLNEGYAGMAYGNTNILLMDNGVYLNGKVNIDKAGQIHNVTAGTSDEDAVNLGQLKGVENVAKKGWNLSTGNVATDATNVAPGDYVDFSGDKNISVSHDGTDVKVALNKNIDVNSVQTNALNSKYNLSVGTMGSDGKTGFFVNSNGAFYGARGNFVVDENGDVTATSGDIGNVKLNHGVFYKNSALRDGELYVGDADGNYSQITSKNAKLGQVTIDATGKISGVAAGRIAADSTDAINGSQLHAVQTEAGKHTTLVNGSNINVEEIGTDGQKTYKVGLNKDILLGDITGQNVSISGTNGTIETTGNMITESRVIADKGAKLADIDVTKDTISGGLNGQSKVVLNEGYAGMSYGNTSVVLMDGGVYLNGKVNVDKAGQIHNVTAGTADEDAVNVGQLKKETAAAKTTVSDGTNTTVTSTVDTDGHTDYQVNLNKDLKGVESISNGPSKVVLNEGYAGMAYGNTNIVLMDNGVYLNGKVNVDKAGQIHNVTAGTADEDAVNFGQLKEKTAAAKTTVSDGTNTTVTSTIDKDGHTDYQVNLNKDLKGVESISNGPSKVVLNEGYAGMAYGNTNIVLMDSGVYLNGKVNVDKAGQIHNVTAGTADEDAVNFGQLKKETAAAKTTVSDGTNTTVTSKVEKDGHTDYQVNLNKDLEGIESVSNGLSSIRMGGKTGTVTINNVVTIDQTGKISGVANGEISDTSKDAINGSQLAAVKKDVAQNATDIKKNAEDIKTNADNIQKNTESIKENADQIKQNADKIQANSDAIAKNTEDIKKNAENIEQNKKDIATNKENISKNTEAIGKLDERVTSVEEVAKKHTTVSSDDENVQLTESTNAQGGKDYKVGLNKDLKLDSVTTGDTKMDTNGVKVGDTVSLTKDGLTAGDTKVTGDGLSIGDKTYISKDGLNANDQKVSNVAAGDLSAESKDAINGSQLFATNQQVAQNAQNISKLGNRINKVGAGAAALAALHPLDFDPDDKWDFAAGYGNYNGENAAAIGAYYRPNEDTMFSVGGSFGNGENMVNAGISLKLGQGNHVSTSKVAMAKEIKDLRKELETLKSAMLDVNAGKKLDTSKLQLFPDVPQNHWAYEYVSQLKGNGILTGYPDGEFKGDRPMTRYEFAAMLYKAMLEGATLSDKILTEFAPELERFTVDTVHADKNGKPVVERVRVVKNK